MVVFVTPCQSFRVFCKHIILRCGFLFMCTIRVLLEVLDWLACHIEM